jgi:formylmethanofuran dehydrogenase subunit C
MDAARELGRTPAYPPALAISKRFGRYKDEGEHAVRAPDFKENQALAQFIGAFKKLQGYPTISELENSQREQDYSQALALIKGISYTSDDVALFSVALKGFEEEYFFHTRAGLLLSALINNGDCLDYCIMANALSGLNYLGYRNTKNITVNGNNMYNLGWGMEAGRIRLIGDWWGMPGTSMKGGAIEIEGSGIYVGACMGGGSITVNGDATVVGEGMADGAIFISGNCVCAGSRMSGGSIVIGGNCLSSNGADIGEKMEGGSILVKGNTSDMVGLEMRGGMITIEGRAGAHNGMLMSGGELHFNGDFGGFEGVGGGRIYHKGRLVFPQEGQK